MYRAYACTMSGRNATTTTLTHQLSLHIWTRVLRLAELSGTTQASKEQRLYSQSPFPAFQSNTAHIPFLQGFPLGRSGTEPSSWWSPGAIDTWSSSSSSQLERGTTFQRSCWNGRSRAGRGHSSDVNDGYRDQHCPFGPGRGSTAQTPCFPAAAVADLAFRRGLHRQARFRPPGLAGLTGPARLP